MPVVIRGKKRSKGRSWAGKSQSSDSELQRITSRVANAEKRLQAVGAKIPSLEDDPWYIDVLNFIQRPQRAITGALAEATDRDKGSILQAFFAGLTGKEQRDFDEVLSNLGWRDRVGKLDLHDVVSFLGDTALDPLTYLTFGGATLSRAAKAGRTAQQAANQLVGFTVPFTGREYQLLAKPSFLRKTPEPVDIGQARSLAAKYEAAGFKDNRKEIASRLLGKPVDSFKNINVEEFKFLDKAVDDYLRRQQPFDVFEPVNPNAFKVSDFLSEDTLGKLSNLKSQLQVDDLIKGAGQFVPQEVGRSPLRRAFDNSALGKTLANTIGRWFGGVRYVPPQMIAEMPELRGAVDLIHDTETKIHARQKQAINDIAKKFKDLKLSKEQREAIPYIIEGRAPEGFDLTPFVNDPKVQEAVQFAQTKLKEIADIEQSLGILKGTRENYVPHLYEGDFNKISFEDLPERVRQTLQRSPSSPFSREREAFDTIAEFEEFIRNNPNKAKGLTIEKDIAKILAEREAVSIKARNNVELFNELEQRGFVSGVPKPNFTEVTIAGKGKIYAHPEVAHHLKAVDRVFSSDKFANDFWRKVNQIQNIWKKQVTAAIPAHYFRNFVGNVWNNSLAGVGPSAYAKALDELAKKGNIYEKAIDHGIIKQGFYGADFETTLTKEIDSALGMSKNPLDWIPDLLRKSPIGEPVEDWTRLAHFIHVYEATGDFKKAAESVKKYLFNYFELSPTERTIKTFVPFYTWMRNNIPLQLEQLVKQPRFAIGYARLQEQSVDDSAVPDWMEQDFFPFPFFGQENTYYNPYLPVQDLRILSEPGRELVNAVSPIFSMPFEIFGANKDFFTGAPIDRFPEDRQYDWENFREYMADQTGLTGKLIETGRAIATGDNLLNEILGLIIGEPRTINPEEQRMRDLYDYDRMLQDILRRLRSQGVQVPSVRDLQ